LPAFDRSFSCSASRASVPVEGVKLRRLPASANASSPGASIAATRPGPLIVSSSRPRSSAVTQPAANSTLARVFPVMCGVSNLSRTIFTPLMGIFSVRVLPVGLKVAGLK
jgi:hypothetical protein